MTSGVFTMLALHSRLGRRHTTVALVVASLVVALALAAGVALVAADPGGKTVPAITGLASSTHPDADAWYQNDDPELAWDVAAGITGYSYQFDKNPATEPDATLELRSFGFTGGVVPVGARPHEITTGDLDGDGVPDLVTPDFAANTVSVALGKGDGTFHAARAFATGSSPRGVALGHFDGDAHLDVVVTNRYSSPATMSVLLGNGDGTLKAKVDYLVGGYPKQVVAEDFDGDGKLDVAMADSVNDKASVLLGNGDGTFRPYYAYPAGKKPEAIASGDVNGDGKLDLIVANQDGDSISILLGNGNGTFQSGVEYAAGSHPHDLAVADFDGDGDLDIAVADYVSETVSVLLGFGNGVFAARTPYTAASVPSGVEAADLNGDGVLDLAVSDWNANAVEVLFGKGDGTFARMRAFSTSVGSNPNALCVADFDGDGAPDLATADSGVGSSSATVLLNTRLDQAPGVSYADVPEGVWYFHVRTVAAGGVLGDTTHRAVRIDRTAPVTTDDAPAGFASEAVTVTLTPSDGGSGMSGGEAGTWYRVGGDGELTQGTSVLVSEVGIHTVEYYSVDAAGNAEAPRSTRVTIVPAAAPEVVYVDASWDGATSGTDPDGDGPVFVYGYDGFASPRAGIDAVAAPGGTVLVNPGTYTVPPLVIDRSVSVVSTDGPDVTTLRALSPGFDLITVTADEVALEGFTIRGSLQTVVKLDGADGVTVSGNKVLDGASNVPTNGIWVEGGSGTILVDNVVGVSATAVGIGVHAVSDFSLTGNSVTSAGTHGVRVFDASGVELDGNTVGGVAGGRGIGLVSSSDVLVTGNTVSGNQVGVVVSTTTGTTLSGNTIAGNTTFGVRVVAGATPPKVNGNSIAGNGIGLRNESGVVVDALHNWWGDASGPYDAKTLPGMPNYNNPGGTGDAVDPYVNYDRWFADAGRTTLSDGYAVAVSVVGFGSVAKEPHQAAYDWGQVVALTATPDTGWRFAGWSGDAGGVGSPVNVTVNGDKAVTATFAVLTYTITPSAGANGGISPATPQVVAYGATPAFTFTPDAGYRVAAVRVDGEPVELTGENAYQFPPVAASHSIAVEFALYDTQPPTVGDNADDVWRPLFVLVFSGEDDLSGIDHFAYRLGDGEWQTGASVLFLTRKKAGNSGVQQVTYKAVDGAGNWSEEATCEVLLDGIAPRTVDDAPRDAEGEPVAQAGDVTVRLTAGDAHAGVAGTWWTLDYETWFPYEGGIVIEAPANGSKDGLHWILYRSVDHAGNVENLRRCAVLIDTGGG